MNKVLIIGFVWLEKTSGAGSRMFQLIEQLLVTNNKITFASSAQKTENSFDLSSHGIQEQQIKLNSSTFDDFIKELQPDIVIFDRFMIEEQFGWRIAEYLPNALRILDTEDLHSLRKTRYEYLKKGKSFTPDNLLTSTIAKREIASILRCDLSLIISSYEVKILKDIFKIDENLLIHLPFLLDKITANHIDKLPSFEDRKDFIFVGNFLHQPNVDAVLQLKTIWSEIRKSLPDVNLNIYGVYPTQQIKQLHNNKEGFIIKGYVEDIINEVQQARIVLAPLRFGAGIKGKLTEAMQCGTPSITTSIGSEGMHENMPWNGSICKIDEFANKAIELYNTKNTWQTAQQNGFDIINSLYKKEPLGNVFIKRINEVQTNLLEHRQQNFLGSLLHYQTLNAAKYMSKWIEEKNKS